MRSHVLICRPSPHAGCMWAAATGGDDCRPGATHCSTCTDRSTLARTAADLAANRHPSASAAATAHDQARPIDRTARRRRHRR